MKLLNIHIDNFGKISDFDMDMSVNPVIIVQNNGWGKSTCAAFIKVMFFGFEGENKKSIADREREHYRPWNKGIYGGSIIFETGQKEYELTRHFGAKERDDSSQLVDITTQKETADIDKNRIGEQLFGIDAESFLRTVYIGQGRIAVHNASGRIEDGISAKIGKLTEATDDVNNYEAVRDKLKSAMNDLKYGKKGGKINELESERTGLLANVRQADAVDEGIETCNERIRSDEERLQTLNSKRAALELEYKNTGAAIADRERRKYREKLTADRDNIKERLNECEEFFGGNVPSDDEIAGIQRTIRDQENLKVRIDELEKRTEGMSGNTDINPEELNAQRRNLDIYERMTDEEKQCETDMMNLEHRIKMERDFAKNRADMLIIIAAIVILASAVLVTVIAAGVIPGGISAMSPDNTVVTGSESVTAAGVSGNPVAGYIPAIITALAGLVLLIIGIIRRSRAGAGAQSDRERSVIERKRSEAHEKAGEAHRELREYASRRGIAFDISQMGHELYRMEQVLRDKDRYEQAYKQLEDCKAEEVKLRAKTDKWFEGIAVVDGVRDMNRITTMTARYNELKEALRGAEAALNEEAKNSTTDVNAEKDAENRSLTAVPAAEPERLRDLEEISAEKAAAEEEIEKLASEIRGYRSMLEERLELRDRISDSEERLKEVDELLKEYNRKYDIILKTAEYIDKAKERLNIRYMNPIGEAYGRYYGAIADDTEKYKVDAGINVTKRELGEIRQADSFSQGYKDLTDLALRMALIDVMYDTEKPFIVLDDPFVNLDTEKMEKALGLLNILAKDHQVIYFTCHGSRALNGK